MSIASFFAGFILSVVVAYTLTKKFKKDSNNQSSASTPDSIKKMTLEETFGQPVNVSTFSLDELTNWVSAREQKLKNNCKVLVARADANIIKQLENCVEIGLNKENFLVIAIVNRLTMKKEDSALIHYEKLDPNLEKMLENGNGELVIED